MFWIIPKNWNNNLAGSQKIEQLQDLWNLQKQSWTHIPLVETDTALNPVQFDCLQGQKYSALLHCASLTLRFTIYVNTQLSFPRRRESRGLADTGRSLSAVIPLQAGIHGVPIFKPATVFLSFPRRRESRFFMQKWIICWGSFPRRRKSKSVISNVEEI